jgi:hypothetical protein
MPHTMSSTWPTLEIQTSGQLGFDEQNEILSSVVEILRAAPVSVVHIDHSTAEIVGTTEEAHAFGHRVGEALKPFEKVFVAIFVGNEARVAPLVDVSVMIAKKLGVRISTFNDFDRLVLQTSRHLTDLI